MAQGSPYQFNANDIRRYFEGKMTPSEKHALESAALEDPFLADALEGFEMNTAAAAAADLSILKAKLAQRVEPLTAVPLRPKQWLSIAAATVVVLGSAVALWLATGSPEQKTIARLEVNKVEERAPILADSNSQPEIAASNQSKELASKPSAPKPKTTEASKSANMVTESADTTQKALALKDESKPEEKQAGVLDRLDRSKLDDEASKKSLRAVPSAVAPMSAKKEEQQLRIYAEPADGWSSFEVYLHTNLRKPKDPVITGNVIVSFSVNPENGKLYDLKIDKSLHPLYDKEAIRILKEGPAWTVYNTEGPVKTTYTVVF